MTYSINFPILDPGGGAYYQGANGGGAGVFILKFAAVQTGIEEDAKLPVPILLNVPTFFTNKICLRFIKSREEPIRIILYNPLGNPVFERSYPRTSSVVTLSDKRIARLPSGVYFLKVYSGKREIGEFKLIKE